MKLSALHNASNVSEAYKRKLEELIEYKNRFEELSTENDSLRKQMFDIQLNFNTEQRFQILYEKAREELTQAKEELYSAELTLKKSQTELNDKKKEVERLSKSEQKKNEIIQQLSIDLERFRMKEICGSSLNSSVLGDHFDYEDKIRTLENEVEELRRENDNYANNEIIKLENILQSQHEQSVKSKKEKDYYEERCNILEKQNIELKNRIETLKLGNDILLNI